MRPPTATWLCLQISINRASEVGRTEGDETGLPISELSCGRQINVQEIWIAAIQCKGSWTPRQLGTIGNMIEVSTPDRVDREVPTITGIAEREPLIE